MPIPFQPAADTPHHILLEPRDEKGNRLVQNLLRLPPEILDCTRIDFEDMTVRIGNHHRIVHPGQKLAEKRLAVLRDEEFHYGLLYQIRR